MEDSSAISETLFGSREKPLPVGELASPVEVAQFLGVTPDTLANWRCTKRVRLPYLKIGGGLVRYRRADVIAFCQASLVDGASIPA